MIYIFITEGAGDVEYMKIGYSSSPKSRLKVLQASCPFKLKLYLTLNVGRTGERRTELVLHEKFNKYKTHSEWFTVDSEVKKHLESFCVEFKDLIIDLPQLESDRKSEDTLSKLKSFKI